MPAPDVLIVGGGVIGLSCGVELGRRGRSVTVLERGEVGAQTGPASWAGAGMLPPASLELAVTPRDRLRALSHARWDDWAAALREETSVEIGYSRRGSLHVSHPNLGGEFASGQEAEAYVTSLQQVGVRAARLRPDDGRLHAPGLSRDVSELIRVPAAGQVRNPRLLRALRGAGHGMVEVREGVPVRSLRRSGGRIVGVTTETGERIDAGAVLICGGAWTGGLLADAGFAAPVRPVRGQIALLRTRPGLFSATIECGRRYLVPRTDGRLIVGATQEEAGFHATTTAGGLAELLDFARTLAPVLEEATVERCWAGLRPGTPDGNPLLGRVPQADGEPYNRLLLAAGHFRDGLQQSPGTAAILADLIEGNAPAISLDGFAPDRFSKPEAE
ncbi:NAD(P)/FAD-dependent oxidoreductase [Alienimonas chondri]|uniref:Glycine oxidase n=1 Tax=Alienimonas chondri TaxID=2681879 RepID=A0ABX1V9P7_9PLAN|nr:FAD-dependent oxidoreductase [Alienimonas chondri]NNJ24498.1 Glycine oxidase [Alienimonas chondri]